MENGRLMKVEVLLIAPCNTFDLHEAIIDIEKSTFMFFLNGRIR